MYINIVRRESGNVTIETITSNNPDDLGSYSEEVKLEDDPGEVIGHVVYPENQNSLLGKALEAILEMGHSNIEEFDMLLTQILNVGLEKISDINPFSTNNSRT